MLLAVAGGPAAAVDPSHDLAALAPAYLADMPRLKALKQEATSAGAAGAAGAAVAVFADYGVWSGSARALVDAVRGGDQRVRVLDRTDLTARGLSGVRLLFVPGGLAPFQWQAMGPQGLSELGRWVEGGGRLVGLCAGAYLVSREVRYLGQSYPYPLGLFDGTAEGPVKGLAAYPQVGPVSLTLTRSGEKRGLKAIEGATLAYGGGPRFLGGTGVDVLARFPDGTPAVIARRRGRGEIVLSGAHVELAPGSSAWEARAHPSAPELVRALAGPYPVPAR
jgi:glutamine amidotransferase-like uncharacterized protein